MAIELNSVLNAPTMRFNCIRVFGVELGAAVFVAWEVAGSEEKDFLARNLSELAELVSSDSTFARMLHGLPGPHVEAAHV